MSEKKLLVLAYVTDIHGGCVTYPSCRRCCSKLFIEPTSQSYYCIKCSLGCQSDRVLWRYRLVLSVADDVAAGKVVVFGRTLDPFFGKSAPDFHRSLVDLEQSGYPAESLLVDALTKTFIGSYFYFGFKHCELNGNKPPCLTDILKPSAEYNMGGSQFNKDSDSENLAYQMLSCNSTVHASVTDHMRHYVSILRQTPATASTRISANGYHPADRSAHSALHLRRSCHRTPHCNLSGISNLSASVCSMYRTLSFSSNQDSVHLTFEDNDSLECTGNVDSNFESVHFGSVSIKDSRYGGLVSDGANTLSNSRYHGKDNSDLKNIQSHCEAFSQLDCSDTENVISNTSKLIDRELQRRQKQKCARQSRQQKNSQLMKNKSHLILDDANITQRRHGTPTQECSVLKQKGKTSHTNHIFHNDNELKVGIRPATDNTNEGLGQNVRKCSITCSANGKTTLLSPTKEDADFSEDNEINFFSESQLDMVLMGASSNMKSNTGACETNNDGTDIYQKVDISKQFMTHETDHDNTKLQNTMSDCLLLHESRSDIASVSSHEGQLQNNTGIDLQLPDSEGLETFLRSQHSQILNLDETYNENNTKEPHGNNSQLSCEHAVRIDEPINGLCKLDIIRFHDEDCSENVPKNVKHTLNILDSHITNVSSHKDCVADNMNMDLKLVMPDSEGLETFLKSQYSQDFTLDETSKANTANEQNGNVSKFIGEHTVMADLPDNVSSHEKEGSENMPTKGEHMSSTSDSGVCDLGFPESTEIDKFLIDEKHAAVDTLVLDRKHMNTRNELLYVEQSVAANNHNTNTGNISLVRWNSKQLINAGPAEESQDLEEFLDNISVPCENKELNVHLNVVRKEQVDTDAVCKHLVEFQNNTHPATSNLDSNELHMYSEESANIKANIPASECTHTIERIVNTGLVSAVSKNGMIANSETEVLQYNVNCTSHSKGVGTVDIDPISCESVKHLALASQSKTENVTKQIIQSSESQDLEEFLENISEAAFGEQSKPMTQAANEDISDDNVELNSETLKTSKNKLVMDVKNDNSYTEKYSDIFADSFSDTSSGDVFDLNIEANSIDNMFGESLADDQNQGFSNCLLNESDDLFSQAFNNKCNQIGIISVSKSEAADCKTSMVNVVNDSYESFHIIESPNNDKGIFLESACISDNASSLAIDDSFIIDSPETETTSKLGKLSMCWSRHTLLNNGSMDNMCPKKKVKFDQRLRRVSTCQIMDIKMRNCDSPSTKSARLAQKRSCLRQNAVYDKTKDTHTMQMERISSKSPQVVSDCDDNEVGQECVHKSMTSERKNINVNNGKTVSARQFVEQDMPDSETNLIISHSGSQDLFASSLDLKVDVLDRPNEQESNTIYLKYYTDKNGDTGSKQEFKTSINIKSAATMKGDGTSCKLPGSVEMTPDLWGAESTYDELGDSRHSLKSVKSVLRNKLCNENLQTPDLWSQEIEHPSLHCSTDITKACDDTKHEGTICQQENEMVQQNRRILKCLVLNTPDGDSKVQLNKSNNKIGRHQRNNISTTYRGQENRLASVQSYEESPDLFCDSPVYSVTHNVCDTTDTSMPTKTSILCKKLFFD